MRVFIVYAANLFGYRSNQSMWCRTRTWTSSLGGFNIPSAQMLALFSPLGACQLRNTIQLVFQDEDLDIIFGRFGACSSNIIRDRKTGDSLNYAFIEFDTQESAEQAYEKMNEVIIDDRRIKVNYYRPGGNPGAKR